MVISAAQTHLGYNRHIEIKTGDGTTLSPSKCRWLFALGKSTISSFPRILVVDDDPTILHLVRPHLEEVGFRVVTAASADEALKHIAQEGLPHLAIVDIHMPGKSGLDFCHDVHRYSDLPIIMLTAVNDEKTVVKAIHEFAEDYVSKPFRPKELAARVVRVLKRRGDHSYAAVRVVVIDENLSIDFANCRATLGDDLVNLTAMETKILYILVRRAGRAVPTSYLLQRLWPDGDIFEDALRVHVHRLRQEIERDPANPSFLHTERGVGYTFTTPVSIN